MYCNHCGKKIPDKSSFCNFCGQKIEIIEDKPQIEKDKIKTNNNSIIITIIVIVVFVGLIVIAAVNGLKQKEEIENKEKINNQISSFYAYAFGFNYNVVMNSADLETIGNDISTYWYNYIYKGKYKNPNDAINKAIKKNEELKESIDETHERIQNLYKNVLVYPEECIHCEEIKNDIDKVYESYNRFYTSILYASGTYSDFQSAFSLNDTDITNKTASLSSKLQVYND